MMTEVCNMFFETELSDKLNNELESAGISVSEALIAKTLAAVQAARATDENEVPDEEWVEASEENVEKLIELAQARKGRVRGVSQAVFRVAAVMAACFVLVVGGFALRFSTMRMGKEEAAPMAAAENSGARQGDAAAMDAAASGDFKYFSETTESEEMEAEMAIADSTYSLNEPIAPTAGNDWADDADAVQAECAKENVELEVPEEQNTVTMLTERLAQAESVRLRKNKQGIRIYEFFVRDNAGVQGFYWVYEDGAVEFAEVPPEGQTNTMEEYAGSENKEFRRTVLVWMKEHGYSF